MPRCRLVRALFLAAAASLLPAHAALAVLPQARDIAGDYAGNLGPMQAKLHLRLNSQGLLSCHLDNQDQGAWVRCENVHLDGQSLSFAVPSLHATWQGSVSSDGRALVGTWEQQNDATLLTFVREAFIPAEHPSPIDGIWLSPPSVISKERIQIVIRSDHTGRESCIVDLPDHYTMGLECSHLVFRGDSLSFDVPLSGAHFDGKLSLGELSEAQEGPPAVHATGQADRQALIGTFTQKTMTGDLSTQYNFTRQATALTGDVPIPGYDPAMPPVSAVELESVLDHDLSVALKTGELAPDKEAGVSIAVVEHGVTRIFAYGVAHPDSIYEIGALTKTFTGLLLAQMVEQGKVRLDQPLRKLLPTGTVSKPQGPEITLIDLATQRSGLPPMPDNINLADMENPYAGYRAADLYAYISKRGVARTSGGVYPFSGGLGFALLGQALADRAGSTYAALLNEQIILPLALRDTTLTLSSHQQARFLTGHDEFHHPAHAWDMDALAPTAGLHSTASDLLTWLQANLHPESLKALSRPPGVTLSAALLHSHQLYARVAANNQIALGWFYESETGNYWHNGATAAHSVYVFFNPQGDYAAAVLLNTSPGAKGAFVERLGQHISQRLAGKPAISLAQ